MTIWQEPQATYGEPNRRKPTGRGPSPETADFNLNTTQETYMIGLVHGMATAAYMDAYGYTVKRARPMASGQDAGMVSRELAKSGVFFASVIYWRKFDACPFRMS